MANISKRNTTALHGTTKTGDGVSFTPKIAITDVEFLNTRLSELGSADTALDTRVTALEENSSGGGNDSLYPYPYDSNGQCIIAVQFPDACFIPAITTVGPDDGGFSDRYINLDYLMPVQAGTKFGQLYFTTPFVIPGANGLMPEREYTVQAIAFEAGSYEYDQIGYMSGYNIIEGSGPTIFRTFDMSTDLNYNVVYGGGWQGEVVWTLSRKNDKSAADGTAGPARLDLGIRRRLLGKSLLSNAIEGSLPTVYLQVTMSSH